MISFCNFLVAVENIYPSQVLCQSPTFLFLRTTSSKLKIIYCNVRTCTISHKYILFGFCVQVADCLSIMLLLTVAYTLLFGFWLASYFVIIPVTLNLITTSLCIIIIASSRSLKITPYLADQTKVEVILDRDGHEVVVPIKRETLSAQDAYMFPVFGSCSLFGLYCAFKYLDPEWVQFFMSGYFALAGVFAITATFVGVIKSFPGLNSLFNKIILNYKTKFSLFGFSEDIHLFITTAECVSFVPSVAIVYLYLQNKHFMLNNLIGMAFCIQAIENMSVGSVKIATILQIGLFFYDIFWVFGTEVMVSVAKNVKGPLLLQFPRTFANAALEIKGEFSMLGLGDIVIPGLFIALLYRLDTSKYIDVLLVKQNTESVSDLSASSSTGGSSTGDVATTDSGGGVTADKVVAITKPAFVATIETIHEQKYPATYFHAALIAYGIGLLMTVGVMFYFGAAQPALLYLVPCALCASSGVAVFNGEFMTVYWNYTEEVPEEDKKEGAVENTKKDK